MALRRRRVVLAQLASNPTNRDRADPGKNECKYDTQKCNIKQQPDGTCAGPRFALLDGIEQREDDANPCEYLKNVANSELTRRLGQRGQAVIRVLEIRVAYPIGRRSTIPACLEFG